LAIFIVKKQKFDFIFLEEEHHHTNNRMAVFFFALVRLKRQDD